jgi:ATP-dependent RNA helicase RhlE
MKRKLDVQPVPDVNPPSNKSTSSSSGKMSDPFFYKPYEPSNTPQASSDGAKPEEKKVGIVPAKPAVGALLGGFKKK